MGVDNETNLVKVFYVLDQIGVDVPEQPDEIPDKYQITFTYVSGVNGSVSGAASEVHTIQKITRDQLTHEITAIANSGSVFSNWNIEGNAGKIYNNTQDITKDSFETDTTFVANFSASNNNDGNDGGGSGGSGGGGGGGTSSGGPGRYTDIGGGPGAVTIAPEEVPLAALPETLIEEDDVPLAPLPKTGQKSLRAELTMVLSGIFLVITAVSRKRKEDA